MNGNLPSLPVPEARLGVVFFHPRQSFFFPFFPQSSGNEKADLLGKLLIMPMDSLVDFFQSKKVPCWQKKKML